MRRQPFLCRNALLLSGTALVSTGLILFSQPALADCSFSPPTGNDTYICDSGVSAGALTDPGGNNELYLPETGTGTIDGGVTFGGGTDRIEIHSGTILGPVNQGEGDDTFVITGGTVEGNVQQGAGEDDFRMSGGTITSLNQGDNTDDFFMSGGRIIDYFDDGDYAVMTGGRIGRVNMKLENNTFDMSGGTIDRNLVTGFGNDTIILSNGTIGGNISVSGGTDSVTVTGGTVGGEVRMSAGEDIFTWDGGGIIYGLVDLGGDDDTATLANLTDANIGATPQITGGEGTDELTFDNVKTGDVARFDSWEVVALTNDTELVFDDTLVLGDAVTGTGALTIDATSTVYGGEADAGISAFAAGQLASVVNAGRIDLTNGGGSAGNSFTIGGNYEGQGGQVFLDTVLGDDSSASDRLVIAGDATGTTGLNVINAGGSGASTTQDGILVVDVGGVSESGAFGLNHRVAAGAYEYYLFKGGVSADTQDNWYLRSTLVQAPTPPEPAPAPAPLAPPAEPPTPQEPETTPPPPPSEIPDVDLPTEGDETTGPEDNTGTVDAGDPEPEAPPAPPEAEEAAPPPPPPALSDQAAPVPVPGPAVTPPSPGATPVIAESVPLYRVEVPTYAAVPPVAHHLALSTLGTFHERRGEQVLLERDGWFSATWARVFGQDTRIDWEGTVDPGFDGNLSGFQAGQDVAAWQSEDGHQNRLGLFLGNAFIEGDITGQALGWNDLAVGEMNLTGTSLGGYWSHIGPEAWYLDAVLMGTWFHGDAVSNSDIGIDIDGTGITASLEGGYPFVLSPEWTLEPQAQVIWSHLSLDDTRDDFSAISFDTDDIVTGRLGLRLQGNFETEQGVVRPYLKANLWQNFSADQTISFGEDPIVTEIGGTSLELGAGIVADLNENLSLFATADYTTGLDSGGMDVFEGNLGLSFKW